MSSDKGNEGILGTAVLRRSWTDCCKLGAAETLCPQADCHSHTYIQRRWNTFLFVPTSFVEGREMKKKGTGAARETASVRSRMNCCTFSLWKPLDVVWYPNLNQKASGLTWDPCVAFEEETRSRDSVGTQERVTS